MCCHREYNVHQADDHHGEGEEVKVINMLVEDASTKSNCPHVRGEDGKVQQSRATGLGGVGDEGGDG